MNDYNRNQIGNNIGNGLINLGCGITSLFCIGVVVFLAWWFVFR